MEQEDCHQEAERKIRSDADEYKDSLELLMIRLISELVYIPTRPFSIISIPPC